MSDTDQSINNLRYNQVTQGLEGAGGGTPIWTPLVLVADGGMSQLTGDVTAGPGGGSQTATIAAGAVTNVKINATAAIAFSKLAALPSADILVGNGSNVATAVALSGDATLSNSGALTLATVNGNVGSFTSANITVDAKGRITAAANGSGGSQVIPQNITTGPIAGPLSTTSGSYVTTPFTLTATLQKSTNRWRIKFYSSAARGQTSNHQLIVTIFKDGVDLCNSAGGYDLCEVADSTSPSQWSVPINAFWEDAPGDTSAHTYDIRFLDAAGTAPAVFLLGNAFNTSFGVFALEEILS